MEIRFRCTADGRAYHAVWRQGRELFVGTLDECERYIEVHREKLRLEQVQERMPQRSRPVPTRTYRSAGA